MPQVRIGWRPYVDSGLDVSATAFSNAAGITDSTQRGAVNTLVKDLKRFGLWSKIKAFYPFVGGTANSHKFNLIDPRDLNEAYRLSFSGGWTHSSMGVKTNGSNTSATTFLNLRTVFGATSTKHLLGIYINENPIQSLSVRGFRNDIGANDGTNVIDAWVGGQASQMFIRNIPSADWFSNLITPFDVSGLSEIKRYKENYYCITRNGEEVQTYRNVTATTRYNPNSDVYIGSSSSQNRYALAYIAEPLDSVDSFLMYISVQRFCTSLGRHVGTGISPITISSVQATQSVVTSGMKVYLDARTLSKPAEGATGSNGNWYLGVAPGNYFLGSASWTDQSGSGNHGTFWSKPEGAGGDSRSAQYFVDDLGIPEVRFRDTDNGTGRYKLYQYSYSPDAVTTTYKGSDTGTYTFGGWIKMNSLHNYFNIIRGEDSVWMGGAWSLQISGSIGGKLGIGIVASGGSIQGTAVSATVLKADTWYNIYCVWKPGSYYKFYINGTLQLTNAMTYTTLRTPNGPYGWLIGSGKLGQYHQRGIFGALHIYDRELTPAEIKQNFDADKNRYNVVHAADDDAHAFVTSAGITSASQAAAVNTLVTSLKTAGIWTKMKAIYPFVGGTAESHKFNLKDPRDADAAYRLVFSGGSTHSSDGYIGNGANSYADTKLSPFAALAGNDNHLSVYSNLNVSDSSAQVGNLSPALVAGSTDASYSQRFDMGIDYVDTVGGPRGSFVTNTMLSTQISWVDSTKTGLYTMTRTSSTSFKAFKNASLLGSNANANSTQLPNFSLYLGAWNNGGNTRSASRRIAFASVGSGLTDAEAAALYSAVQAFQTSLGRQV